jgi:hypothetical protein
MTTKLIMRIVLCLALAQFAFAQDRGTITGTIGDSTGALIPGAKISLVNTGTEARYETVASATGNYTVTGLPAGVYTASVEHPGFSAAKQTNIRVQVAVTTRVDIVLQVGQATQTVEVTADSTMLKTESAEQSTTITGDTINNLPINFAIGAGAIRNPLSFVQLTPGASISGWNTIKVNGNPTGTFRILFEGQESSSGLDARVSDESQPSVEAIQEFTLQTSNFAAEYGLVAGGLFNFTSRSGTNQFHGSAYDYITNEALNAGVPFTDDGTGRHRRIQSRLHDFGFSIGGPVRIPKVYNGRNKTFFFWNYEHYRDKRQAYFAPQTVPTDAFRNGDLSAILNINGVVNRNIGTDPFGRPIFQNQIYDPQNFTVVNGQRMLQPFPNNMIPSSRIDPVARKILDTLPRPTVAGALVNNYQATLPFQKIQKIPSLKIDHTFSDKSKISGYWSQQNTDKDVGQDGLPWPISRGRVLVIKSTTVRINYDHSLTPTTLLHLGAGVQRYRNPDSGPPEVTEYDAAGLLGIIGAPGTGYPRLGGLGNSTFGGMSGATGTSNRQLYLQVKPTGVAQLTHIRGSHTFKAGGEWKIDTFSNISAQGLAPSFNFSGSQTAQPLYGTTNLPTGTTIGHGFASFLLGYFSDASIGNESAPQYRRSSWGFFVQDTWKATRKLTLDIGLRYDLQKPNRELWGRQASFRADVMNPKVNRLGGIVYENQCDCNLAETYPYAIAPRIGIAYQITPKTVLRAGWGLSYSTVNNFAYIGASPSTGFNTISFGATDPVNNGPAGKLSEGLRWNQNELFGAAYDQGFNAFVPGFGLQNAVGVIDPNGGRPPRVNQWSVSLQREVVRDLVVEAAYVGNRGVWFQGNGLVNYNALDPAYLNSVYARYGLNPTVAADRTIITGTISSPAAIARGFTKPYANFPDNGTVIQSLRPFPQYNGVNATWAPLGKTYYDALQVKATKRYSAGVDATLAYAYSKNLTNTSATGNIFDRDTFKGYSAEDRPHILTMSINYAMPAYGFAKKNAFTRAALSGWTIGAVLQYQSGQLLASPGSNNSIGTYYPGQSSRQFRVPGEPLFTKDLNCDCIKPDVETVLNPAAWADAPLGTFGAQQTYYSDFRGQRRPTESMSFGKRFVFGEKTRKSFTIRAELFNVFNRMVSLPDPSTGSPQNPPTRNAQGVLTGGFGFINYLAIDSNNQGNAYPAPRTGQFVARFEF